MKVTNPFKRMSKAALLVMAMVFGWQGYASADMVGTQQLLADSQLQQQRTEVASFMARDSVRQQLMAHGVDADAALSRINSLSAAELGALHGKIDELPAGEGVLETVLALVLIFILLDLAGVTDIFPGV